MQRTKKRGNTSTELNRTSTFTAQDKTYSPQHLQSVTNQVVAWLSGSALVSINVVTLCRAQLILGRVTICGQVNHLYM